MNHDFRPVLTRALAQALDQLAHLDTRAVGTRCSLDELRRRFDAPMPDDGCRRVGGAAVHRPAERRGPRRLLGYRRKQMLNVPFDAGYVFVRQPSAHQSSLSHRAAYLSHEGDARDATDWTPEWSRRGRGFATYAALRQLGRRGLASMVEGFSGHAHTLVTRIGGGVRVPRLR